MAVTTFVLLNGPQTTSMVCTVSAVIRDFSLAQRWHTCADLEKCRFQSPRHLNLRPSLRLRSFVSRVKSNSIVLQVHNLTMSRTQQKPFPDDDLAPILPHLFFGSREPGGGVPSPGLPATFVCRSPRQSQQPFSVDEP